MSLYSKKSTNSHLNASKFFSFENFLLAFYIFAGIYHLALVANLNASSDWGAQDFIGYAYALVLLVFACVAIFRRDVIFLMLGAFLSIPLPVIAFLGNVVDNPGYSLLMDTFLWLHPSFALKFLIGFQEYVGIDGAAAFKNSFVLNSLVPLIIFSISLVIRKMKNKA